MPPTMPWMKEVVTKAIMRYVKMWMPLERALTSLLRMAVRANRSLERSKNADAPQARKTAASASQYSAFASPPKISPGRTRPSGPPGEISPVVDDHPENLGEGEGRDGEIHGPQPQDDEAEEKRHEGGENAREAGCERIGETPSFSAVRAAV